MSLTFAASVQREADVSAFCTAGIVFSGHGDLTITTEAPLGIGTSILLIAVGAILRYAVTAHVSGISLHVVGLILMIAGIVGLVLSLFWMTIYADRRREHVIVRDRGVIERDTTV